jgi:pimeloyl-ACP methyl ester carboxylesterase
LKVWEVNERTGFGGTRLTKGSTLYDKYVRVPLNPDRKSDGSFDLYYFMQTPTGGTPEVKTILFCAGGPGEIVLPGDHVSMTTFLAEGARTTYNIVYFHLRGAGLSQLSPSNDSDKFLRTAFAAEDIEKLRKQILGDRPWDGIIGYSYGTVLAHQYAAKYSSRVRKLILAGPLSMHKFKGSSSMTAYEDYSTEVRRVRQDVLMKIFENNTEFKDRLTATEKEQIKTALEKVFETVEVNFGTEKFIIDRYCNLKNRGILDIYELQSYSRLFFTKLRELRNVGWNPFSGPGNAKARQVEAVQVISVNLKPELRGKLGTPRPDIECTVDSKTDGDMNTSYRTLYAVRAYDGVHQRFLKEWLVGGRSNVRRALQQSAGVAHVQNGVNESIEKLGIVDDEPIQVWDPAEHQHNVPTLILEGGADPVTADKQAEYYFKHALIGPRTLINFPGVGHEFNLPQVNVGEAFVIVHSINQPFVIGSVRLEPGKIAPGSAVAVSNKITAFPPGAGKPIGPTTSVTFEGAIFFPNSNVVFVGARNQMDSDQDVKGQQLEYKHRLFTITVTIDSLKVPHGFSWISGSVSQIAPNFVVEKPSNLEQGLELESFHMSHWDELTLRIKNTSGQPIETKAKEWMLFPTNNLIGQIEAPCQSFADVETASQCLIYAFLEMEYEDFKSPKNSLLTYLKDLAISQHCSGTTC